MWSALQGGTLGVIFPLRMVSEALRGRINRKARDAERGRSIMRDIAGNHAPQAVHRVAACDLVSVAVPWDFARLHRREIEENWARRCAANPAFFNGTVHLLGPYELGGPAFCAALNRVRFKDFLYWKDSGYPDSTVFDVFGSALIRSREGHVILGRQREGNLNAGLAYLPGGFIDERDVGADGRIDILSSIIRELREETGLTPEDVAPEPGFIVTRSGQLVSIGAELRSHIPADALAARIMAHIGADKEAELASLAIITRPSDLDQFEVPGYARTLLAAILPEG